MILVYCQVSLTDTDYSMVVNVLDSMVPQVMTDNPGRDCGGIIGHEENFEADSKFDFEPM